MFRQKLSNFWFNIHHKLFPMLERYAGELSSEHKKLITILELIRVEEFIPCMKFVNGRPPKDRIKIARAFVAKMVFKLIYTKQLRNSLINDQKLRIICGWDELQTIPSESKFSRCFNEFSKSQLPEKIHEVLIQEFCQGSIIGHVVKDSVPLDAREKPLKKESKEKRQKLKNEKLKRQRQGELNRRQNQLKETNLEKMIAELPNACDKGMKKSSRGYTTIWKGYKAHVSVDDYCMPLAVIITSASLNDCEVAIPLAKKTSHVASNFYDLMDAAYDYSEIKEHSISLGHIPIIDKLPHGVVQKKEKEDEEKRKEHLNFQTAEDTRYKERFSKERFNAMFKDYYGGRNIFYKGHPKVSCHVMFGILTLTASIILGFQ